MKKAFNFRSWPLDKTARLKKLWWEGKGPAECYRLLKVSSPRAVYQKVIREGFKRKPSASELLVNLDPVSHETGNSITLENCTNDQCRWGYGLPAADMVLCGRPTVRGPWCAKHREIAYHPYKQAKGRPYDEL